MNKHMVARELVVIARLLTRTSAVTGKDIQEGIDTFQEVERALRELMRPHRDHWSYGASPDPTYDEMMEFAGKLHTEAKKLLAEFQSKSEKWEQAAKR